MIDQSSTTLNTLEIHCQATINQHSSFKLITMHESGDIAATKGPLISIIIPTFNAASTIAQCLDSIRRQTFKDFEVLIMDGMSSDETRKLADLVSVDDSNIHFFCEKDDGTYDAMRKGVASAKGRWLYFLGADDELHDENVLYVISETLRSHPADMVYGDVVLFGDTLFGTDGSRYGGRFDTAKIIKHCICHQAIFYRRSAFEKIGGYDLRYTVCADWDLNLRCFAFLSPHYVDMVIAKFSSGGQSSQIKDEFYRFDRVLNAQRYFNISFFSKYFIGDFTIFRKVAARFLRRGNLAKAFFFMLVAIYQGRKKLLNYALRRLHLGRRSAHAKS